MLHNVLQGVKSVLQTFFQKWEGKGCLMAVLPSVIRVEVNYSVSLRRCAFQNCSANATAGWMGALGLVFNTIPASWGKRRQSPPQASLFVELHFSHAVTMLSQVCCPPLERGITWSSVRCLVLPQYWQVWLSRLSTSRRFTGGTFSLPFGIANG
jgi:hypothetical protein